MKMRPHFDFRFRDAEQFDLIKGEAAREDISMNEYILRGLEGFYVVLKGQRIAAAKMEAEKNGKPGIESISGANGGVEAGSSAGRVEPGNQSGGEIGGGLLGGRDGAPRAGRGNRKGDIKSGKAASERGKIRDAGGEAVIAPEWRCVCGSEAKRMKGKELVCFSCGRGVRESGNGF
jgi:hypothetical protein